MTTTTPELGPQLAPSLGDGPRPGTRAPDGVHVFGPWNSGTCLMFNYPHELTSARTTYHYAFWKHSLPPNWRSGPGCRWPETADGPSDELLESTLLIAMVRLPYFWVRSMLNQSYGLSFVGADTDDPADRLRCPVEVEHLQFPNLVHVWNAYYDAYRRFLEPYAATYVRLEDLVAEPSRIVEDLGRHIALDDNADRNEIIDRISNTPAKVHGPTPCVAGGEAREKYRVSNVVDMFTADDLDFVNRHLDAELMARFGYPIVTPPGARDGRASSGLWWADQFPNTTRTDIMQPKKKDGLIIEEVGDELLVFDDAAQVAAALNRAAAAVFELCDGTRDVDGIVADLRSHTPPLGRDEVALALEELDEAGLIDDVPDVSNPGRRALLAKLGAGAAAAMALPVVEALAAPSPAHAASVPPPSYQPPSTLAPTLSPTQGPTLAPTSGPTLAPTPAPTEAPTLAPTPAPTEAPTLAPTPAPTLLP